MNIAICHWNLCICVVFLGFLMGSMPVYAKYFAPKCRNRFCQKSSYHQSNDYPFAILILQYTSSTYCETSRFSNHFVWVSSKDFRAIGVKYYLLQKESVDDGNVRKQCDVTCFLSNCCCAVWDAIFW